MESVRHLSSHNTLVWITANDHIHIIHYSVVTVPILQTTFVISSQSSQSELFELIRGIARIVSVKERNPLSWELCFIITISRRTMRSCGKLSSNVNGSSFNRNSEVTGLQQLIRAKVTKKLFGRNCGSICRHHRIRTQAISLSINLPLSSRRRSIRFESQRQFPHLRWSRHS